MPLFYNYYGSPTHHVILDLPHGSTPRIFISSKNHRRILVIIIVCIQWYPVIPVYNHCINFLDDLTHKYSPRASCFQLASYSSIASSKCALRLWPYVAVTHPPFSAEDMAQTGEGAYFRICATRLEYKPPPADSFAYNLFSAYITLHCTESILILSSNRARWGATFARLTLARPPARRHLRNFFHAIAMIFSRNS